MSSNYVRETINTFLEDQIPSETVINLDGEFGEIQNMVEEAEIQVDDPWLGTQFLGGDEVPVALTANNSTGKYRETGVIFLHVVSKAALGCQPAMLARAEVIRNKFRGQRINGSNGSVVIDSVSPANFGNGAALQFEGGYTSCVITLGYHYDLNL